MAIHRIPPHETEPELSSDLLCGHWLIPELSLLIGPPLAVGEDGAEVQATQDCRRESPTNITT